MVGGRRVGFRGGCLEGVRFVGGGWVGMEGRGGEGREAYGGFLEEGEEGWVWVDEVEVCCGGGVGVRDKGGGGEWGGGGAVVVLEGGE